MGRFQPGNHQLLDLGLIRHIAQARFCFEGSEQIHGYFHADEPRLAARAAMHSPEIIEEPYDVVVRHFAAPLKIFVRKPLNGFQSSLSNACTSSISCGRALFRFIFISSLRARTCTGPVLSWMRLVRLPFRS